MTVLTINSGSTNREKTYKEQRRKGTNMLQRLGLAKLALSRIGNDLFAIRELVRKAESKLSKLEEGSDKYNEVVAYQASLEVREHELADRRQRLSKLITFRSLDSLLEPEYQWFVHMEPVGVEVDVPAHLHYWLGTTEGNSCHYQRIAQPKLDQNGLLLWKLRTDNYFLLSDEELTSVYHAKEYSYSPICTLADVELENFGKVVTEVKRDVAA